MPYVEARGGSIRVKWWGGEYKLDADGRPTKTKRYESASGPEPGVRFQSEDEAYLYGLDREYEQRHGKGVRRVSAATPMTEYVWMWFEAADLRPNTIRRYRSMLKTVIDPYWGRRPVGDITTIEYEFWKRQIKGQYSENYSRDLLGLFKMLMDDAVIKYKLRAESPVIQQRRRGRYTKKQTKRVKSELPFDAVHQLAVNAHTVWGYTGWAYILTVAFTGMRPPGEMVGLQRGFASPNWPATDPVPARGREAARRYHGMHALRVQHQAYYVGSQPTLAGPKYDSYRTLVIPPFLHAIHEALLASHSSPWVFPSMTGKHLLTCGVFTQHYWRPIRDGAPERKPRPRYMRHVRPEIPAVPEMAGEDLYRLRHWHRELLDEPGADISTVAKEARMGHEVAGMEGVYSRVTIGMETRIVEYLQDVWEKNVVARGLWTPPFPKPLPHEGERVLPPQFSDLPVLDSK
ncbi:transcriptional regulator [Streptomyces viridosporus ATCC 14672]|uniref:Transcriptional regulator n=1 Tax=Streptomyces viridosporus (strain ATCC 14672 / DSM 40746 / JCM 4963 / KCTC 9882 / NRRL B-12104 / FH 1290) TaxID=566461 RepID=D6A4L9_STRV1|nr:N-terminal phage integrase SAM-like domain-containing protein [Streptomyces viridosporus]EFE65859.1 transcriptional regulator [Streptomyces viridosporus ATCC 14672]